MSQVREETFNWGPFTVLVMHHEWDCGDGCCSSSGKTAEITDEKGNIHYFGDEEMNGYLEDDDYAKQVFAEYLEKRDYALKSSTQNQLRSAIDKQYKDIDARNQILFRIVVVAYKLLNAMLEMPGVWGRSKTAQIRKKQAAELNQYILDHADAGLNLSGYAYEDFVQATLNITSDEERL